MDNQRYHIVVLPYNATTVYYIQDSHRHNRDMCETESIVDAQVICNALETEHKLRKRDNDD